MTEPPHTRGSILLVDDTPANLEVLVDLFADHGFDVSVARTGESALERITHVQPDVILLDVRMPGIDGFETCRRLKTNPETRDVPVIFMTALTETEDKIKGFAAGGVDYVTKPLRHEEVLARVTTHVTLRKLHRSLRDANETLEQRVAHRTAELSETNLKLERALDDVRRLQARVQAENTYLREEIKAAHNFDEIVGNSDAVKKVLHMVEQVAPTDTTVLILGESGTGKELLARALHHHSLRKDRPLVKVNCAAISAGLVESELFGHERGAFTGAVDRRVGRFELADGGTIFLDEVGELPLETQSKLLRVLQEQEFERVGSSRTIHVDARVIAATNRPLEEAVRAGAFRSDLFYRLSTFPIRLPPLRERLEDVPLLVDTFLAQLSKKLGKPLEALSAGSLARVKAYAWPGNVRELMNVLERTAILARTPTVEIEETLETRRGPAEPPGQAVTLKEMERAHILHVLEHTSGVIEGQKGAAALLGVHPNTLRSRLQKLGIRIARSAN